ncbi:XRE family transcriptional regulator [Clavibacter michiganensis subsp. michiganensis]|uniref:helix-turn-helix domain-containing protein n=1 Tax=Clavibacter michiganensis TaxID=28447 RepID=UPI000B8CFA6E|nr:XRE family transcriptional regulator [Clavibacter michiganensis subsp. michiganensis]
MTLISEVVASRRLPTPALARAIRETAGVSQARIAEELGVTRMAVSRWERGTRRPRGPLLIAYAAVLRDLQTATGGKP